MMLFVFALVCFVLGEPTVLLHENLPIAIYESVAVGEFGRTVAAGYGWNYDPVAGMTTYDVASGSKINNGFAIVGDDYTIASAHNQRILGATSCNNNMTGQGYSCAVMAFDSDATTSAPLWTVAMQDATDALVAVPNLDGSIVVVALALNVSGGVKGFYGQLNWYSSETGKQVGSYKLSHGVAATALVVDGNAQTIAAFLSNGSVLILTTANNGAVVIPLAFTTDVLCISEDGHVIGTGFTTFQSYQYSSIGKDYELTWEAPAPTGDHYLSACAADRGEFVAAGWAADSYNQNVVQMFRKSSKVPLWTHNNTPNAANDTMQDVVAAMALTEDGAYLAVAAWGDAEENNPQLMVFSQASATPIYGLTTPGSMVAVDVVLDRDNGGCLVAVAGKNVHNNVMGDGGDFYIVHVN